MRSDTDELLTRSAQTIARSGAIMSRSLYVVEQSQRLLIRTIRGGSTADGADGFAERLARLPTEHPTVFAGKGTGTNACNCCGSHILLGSTEYEVEFDGVTIVLDRKCFAIYETVRLGGRPAARPALSDEPPDAASAS